MVSHELPGASIEDQAVRLNEYKPHVSVDEAKTALEDVAEAYAEADAAGLIQVKVS